MYGLLSEIMKNLTMRELSILQENIQLITYKINEQKVKYEIF